MTGIATIALHVQFTKTICVKHSCDHHLTDEKSQTERLHSLPKGTQLGLVEKSYYRASDVSNPLFLRVFLLYVTG